MKMQRIAREKTLKGNRVKPTTKSDSAKIKLRKRGCRSKKRGRVSGTKKSEIQETKNEELLNCTQVAEGVQALLQLFEKTADGDSQLFGDEAQTILMQVAAARIPKTPTRRLRFKLPHPVITDNSDVCIFVKNVARKRRFKSERRDDVERLVERYKARFAKQGISRILQVIPLAQLKTEYGQYEEMRRLCQQFDVFLSDVRIADQVALHLGKFLKYSLKTPIPIRVRCRNLKEEVEKALSRTTMTIHGKGDSFIVQVGHTKQPVEAVQQNIFSVANGLLKEFPGGWDNVSAVYIKTPSSLSIPIYVSLKSPNDVRVPIVRPKRPKNYVVVEAELSTRLGYIAKVYPAGRVQLKKDKTQDNDVEWSDDDWETEWRKFEAKEFMKSGQDESQLLEEKPANKTWKKINKAESGVKEEDQVEDDVVEAEESYLQQWKRKRDEVKKENIKEEERIEPRKKRVKYVVGEMCLGRLGNETFKKPKKSGSGGMVHTAFQELKSKINKKKSVKKQVMAHKKSITCSNKNSGDKKKKTQKGKRKSMSSY